MSITDANAVEAALVEVVELRIPLGHRYVATARVVTSCLAAELGFDVDTIDDLRLGVDEAVAAIGQDSDGADGEQAVLRFEIAGDMLTIGVTRQSTRPPITRTDIDGLALRILEAVTDRFEVTDGQLVISRRVPAGDGG